MSHFFTAAMLIATVAAGVQLATPFLMAALGETMGQRSGVVNLGVDGIMLLGAFGAYYVAAKTGNLLLAAAVGLGIGVVMGLVTAFVSVTLKAEQGISGIGVFLFGARADQRPAAESLPVTRYRRCPSRGADSAAAPHPVPGQDVLHPELAGLPGVPARPGAHVRAQPHDLRDEDPGGGGESRGRGHRRGERDPDPLLDRHHRHVPWPAWPARRCSCRSGSSRRTSPTARASLRSPWSTSAPGGRSA